MMMAITPSLKASRRFVVIGNKLSAVSSQLSVKAKTDLLQASSY
jgi:hypothetical protein